MLIVARDRVRKLKTEGKSAGEIAASRPGGPTGQGLFRGRCFLVQMVYSTLKVVILSGAKGTVVLRDADRR